MGQHIRMLALAALIVLWQPAASQDLNSLAQARGVLEASGGSCVLMDLWLAETPAQQRRGLMYVRNLPENQGMLFIYAREQNISMWMKNTYVSLDMLFIRADGSIARIASDTEPLSLETIRSGEPVSRVLELNAGSAARWGLKPGDRLLSP